MKQYALLSTLIFAAALIMAWGTSCAPNQRIFMKEKTIVKSVPPGPSIRADRFLYQKPYGAVDVIFVVDNTVSAEATTGAFRDSYLKFLALVRGPEAHGLDFRVNVVSSPGMGMPKNLLTRTTAPDDHLAELFPENVLTENGFKVNPNLKTLPLLRADESGHMRPIASTGIGLSHPKLTDRSWVPAFLVYVLGDDSDEEEGDISDIARLSKTLNETRGLHQVHFFSLTRLALEPMADSFPHCNDFAQTRLFFSTFGTVGFASQKHLDLCDPKWNDFHSKLFNSIIEFKRKLVLAQVPHDPETMTLRSGDNSYRYGEDYEYQAATNEIVFLRDVGLKEGDLLSANYFKEPNPEFLSGNQTPSGIPRVPKEVE